MKFQTLHRVLIATAALYVVVLCVFALLWSFAPYVHWSVAVSNVFAAFAFLPIVLLLPVAVLMRSRWMLGLTGIAVALLLGQFGRRFLPRLSDARAEARTVRVATLNELFRNMNGDAISEAVSREHPDLIAFQELTAPVAEVLSRLKQRYPYQILRPARDVGGLGLLSRYPLSPIDRPDRGREQWATVQVDGDRLTVVNVHLHFSGIGRIRSQRFASLAYFRAYDTKGRLGQAMALNQAVREVRGDAIILGDFNTADREPGYRVLAADLHDAFGEKGFGFGFTFPNDRRMGPIKVPIPLVRIDYIWTKGSLAARSAHVNCNDGGSDHCMVIADLVVNGASS
jgi:endonuclease/exonuclease/phosphatase (EEP) superfamily protein YafD